MSSEEAIRQALVLLGYDKDEVNAIPTKHLKDAAWELSRTASWCREEELLRSPSQVKFDEIHKAASQEIRAWNTRAEQLIGDFGDLQAKRDLASKTAQEAMKENKSYLSDREIALITAITKILYDALKP
jgi:hypothetical protein